MGKRLYLCNLIPLWKLDDEKLDVDWVSSTARKNDIVEMRVTVRDLPLALDPPNFSVQFDIKESDFLLTGGLDDEIALIEGPVAKSATAEARSFKALTAVEAPTSAEQLKHIFLTSTKDDQGRERFQLRCFWRAEEQNDVSGTPEYYFDFTLETADEERDERSTSELSVQSDSGGFGQGLGLRPGEEARAVELGIAPAPRILAAGWSARRLQLGEAVQLLAFVEGADAGHPLTFEILDNSTEESEVLERIDTTIENNGIQQVSWSPPRPFPVADLTRLSFRTYVEFVADKIAYSTNAVRTFLGNEHSFHGSLELFAALDIELLDNTGRPLPGMKYVLENAIGTEIEIDGQVVGGVSDAAGRISIPNIASDDVHVRVEDASLLEASEPDLPPPSEPETDEVVFSVVRLLPQQPAGTADE